MLTLVCPQCQASYQLPGAHFGPAGKKVRCAACAHVWIAHDDVPPANDFENLMPSQAAVEEVVETAAHISGAPMRQASPLPVESNSFSDILAAAEAESAAPVLVATRDADGLAKPKMISTKRLDQARAQTAQNETDYGLLKIARWGSAVAAVALILLFTAGSHLIVQKIPGLLPVYQTMGINPLPAAAGFQFVNVSDDSAPEAEDQPLRIHGEVENLTDHPKTAPMLVLHITSPSGQTKQFVHNLHDQVILPHETLAFSIERPHFAEAGWQVDLRFD